jgi:hypothetical protein
MSSTFASIGQFDYLFLHLDLSLLTLTRWFALIRIWSPWLAPRQGKTRFGLDNPGVMCSFLSLEGKHLVLLAISGVDDVMTLFTSDSDGNVVLRVCCCFLTIRPATTDITRFEMTAPVTLSPGCLLVLGMILSLQTLQ